jgi:hypothetical protein
MPYLDDYSISRLLKLAKMRNACGTCGQVAALDYCRTCDEMYWLHAPGCRMHEDKHDGHRLTIVPFVEERKRERRV